MRFFEFHLMRLNQFTSVDINNTKRKNKCYENDQIFLCSSRNVCCSFWRKSTGKSFIGSSTCSIESRHFNRNGRLKSISSCKFFQSIYSFLNSISCCIFSGKYGKCIRRRRIKCNCCSNRYYCWIFQILNNSRNRNIRIITCLCNLY